MKGVPTLDPRADQYELVASEEKREISLVLASSKDKGFQVYEIHASDGTHLLDLFEYADRPRLDLRPPNGDPALLMDHEGGWENYTLRTASNGDLAGIIEYTQKILSYRGWDLHGQDGAVRANVTMASNFWEFLTASPRAPLDATSPEGEWLGTFGLSKDGLNYGMGIELNTDETVLERLEAAGTDRERVTTVERSKVDDALDVTTSARRTSTRSVPPSTSARPGSTRTPRRPASRG